MTENVNDDFIIDSEKVKLELARYRQLMCYMGANVPIEALCLPKSIENILIRAGCVRVYDMINTDLTEIKGLGKTRINFLTARLDEFFTVSI